MAQIKTTELTGAALDWAVRQCEGAMKDYVKNRDNFSTCWNKGGPIIERELIQIEVIDSCVPLWGANTSYEGDRYVAEGDTPLQAAMRCYVASKLGDVIEVPDELVKGK